MSKRQPPLGQHSNPGQLFRPCGPSSAGCWVWSSGESTSEHKGLCSAPCLWVQAEQDHYTGLCSNHDNKRPQNKREALAYCQGLGKPYSRPGCKNPVCQKDSLHWVNTPTLDSCFGLVGHHQQGAECDPVESQPLNIRAYAQPLACGCKLSKITTLACAVTMTTSDHKTREKLWPTAKDSESRTVDLAARTRCVKKTASIGSTLQPWTAVSALWAIISRVLSVIQWRVNLWT